VAAWQERTRQDAAWCKTAPYRTRVDEAQRAIAEFARDTTGYVGVSWGKDSVVLAHLCVSSGAPWPLVWVCMQPVDNPDCPAVRDAFLGRWSARYDEIVMPYDSTSKRTSFPGFAEAERRYGARYLSGVRGAESATRRLSVATHGVSTSRTCRPLARWDARDVWAYLHEHDLPVHPAYACSMGGMLDRDHLRVGALGGQRGRGWGRAEWEERYYGAELRRLESLRR
jgi:phosphoadenosine phosphosulfate reductase